MKRLLLALSCLFMLAPAHAAEKTVLHVWYWGEQEAPGLQDFLADSASRFMSEHPDVQVSLSLKTTDDLYSAFRASTPPPDVQYTWAGIFTLEDAWAGRLAPLNDLLPASELSNYINDYESVFDGKRYGASWYLVTMLGVYNRELLARVGRSGPPATWAELLSTCEALSAQGVVPFALGLKDQFATGWLLSLGLRQDMAGGLPDVFALVAGKQHFNSAPYNNYWKHFSEAIQARCFNADASTLNLYQGQDLFASRQAAMTLVVSSGMASLENQIGKGTLGIMNFPAWTAGGLAATYPVTAQQLTIPVNAPNPKLAAEFIAFLHQPERLSNMYVQAGARPADTRFNVAQIAPLDRSIAVLPGGPWLENFIPGDIWAANADAMIKLFSQNMDATAAAGAIETAAETWRQANSTAFAQFEKWAKDAPGR